MSDHNEPNSSGLMDIALHAAVPMWLLELKDRDVEFLQKRAQVCSLEVASKGDILMYGSKKAGAAGEVFNRLAEGMACLLLITRHPVPFNKTVFYHDRPSETFATEAEANEKVWPTVPKVQEADQGSLQPEAVPPVCESAPEKTGVAPKRRTAKRSAKAGRDDDAT